MRMEIDLIRELVLKIEACTDREGIGNITIPGYSRDQIAYHVYLLNDAGFIKAVLCDSSTIPEAYVILGLTWDGQNFLKNVQNDTIWDQVKARAGQLGGEVSIMILGRLAEALVNTTLGIG
ncbi:MAG: DUF2513 domain-containing protein [Methanospirillum sp.]